MSLSFAYQSQSINRPGLSCLSKEVKDNSNTFKDKFYQKNILASKKIWNKSSRTEDIQYGQLSNPNTRKRHYQDNNVPHRLILLRRIARSMSAAEVVFHEK